VLCLLRKRAGGFKAGRARLDDLRMGYLAGAIAADLEVAEALLPDPTCGRELARSHVRVALVHRAIALLSGHPRVFLGPRCTQPVRIRTAPLTLRVAECAGGGFELVPLVDGWTWPLADLASAAGEAPPGCPLVLIDEPHGRVLVAVVGPQAGLLLARLAHCGAVFPREAREALQARLSRITAAIPIEPEAAEAE
jgi:hypothetical protein